jgi:hypothetical protein
MLLSLRAYARHRGVTLRAVQKAIESGRIETVLDEKGKPKIDPAAADLRWQAQADPAKQRKPEPKAPPPVVVAPKTAPIDDQDDDPPTTDGEVGENDYYKARAKREAYRAEVEKLSYLERAGELVDAAQVQSSWQKIITTAKTRLLSVPSKARIRIPHLTLDDIATIEEEIRDALEELSQGAARPEDSE